MITAHMETTPPVVPHGYKVCADCGVALPVSSFSTNLRASDNLVSCCKACIARQRRERKERVIAEPEPRQPSIVSPHLLDPADIVAMFDQGKTAAEIATTTGRTTKYIARILRAADRDAHIANYWRGRARPIPEGRSNRWLPTEDALLRACRTPLDARLVYEAAYPGKRSRCAVRKRYYDLRGAE